MAEIEADERIVAQQQVVRLQALLEASRSIHSTIALDEVLETVLQIVVRELELTGAFFTTYPHGYGEVPAVTERDVRDPLYMEFPLHDKAGVQFTSLVAILPEGRGLSFDETDFLESLAVQASAAIENALFHKRMVEWSRIESDLAAARQVQQSLLPQTMPDIAGYSLAMRSKACYAVGGDYLDIVPVADGRTVIVVADVAGKGLVSALVGASFRSAFRAMVVAGVPLLEVATRMNVLHYAEGVESRRRYVTAIFVELDGAGHRMKVVNAGHNPAFLVTPAVTPGGEAGVVKIGASGTPVGLIPYSSYEEQTYALEPGAKLLLYTDGMTEVFQGEEEFGEERFLDSFLRANAVDSKDILNSLWLALTEFGDGGEQSDDMTALVLLRCA